MNNDEMDELVYQAVIDKVVEEMEAHGIVDAPDMVVFLNEVIDRLTYMAQTAYQEMPNGEKVTTLTRFLTSKWENS